MDGINRILAPWPEPKVERKDHFTWFVSHINISNFNRRENKRFSVILINRENMLTFRSFIIQNPYSIFCMNNIFVQLTTFTRCRLHIRLLSLFMLILCHFLDRARKCDNSVADSLNRWMYGTLYWMQCNGYVMLSLISLSIHVNR